MNPLFIIFFRVLPSTSRCRAAKPPEPTTPPAAAPSVGHHLACRSRHPNLLVPFSEPSSSRIAQVFCAGELAGVATMHAYLRSSFACRWCCSWLANGEAKQQLGQTFAGGDRISRGLQKKWTSEAFAARIV